MSCAVASGTITSATGDLVDLVLVRRDEVDDRMVEISLNPLRTIVPNRREAWSSSIILISRGRDVSV